MRLWHYKLLNVLDNKHLVSQWRECIAIKRQWEKQTLKHRLVSYVKNYDKGYFYNYVLELVNILNKRNIKYKKNYLEEISNFCNSNIQKHYKEHNNRYLNQCYYNLEEKCDRGIITKDELNKIYNEVKNNIRKLN